VVSGYLVDLLWWNPALVTTRRQASITGEVAHVVTFGSLTAKKDDCMRNDRACLNEVSSTPKPACGQGLWPGRDKTLLFDTSTTPLHDVLGYTFSLKPFSQNLHVKWSTSAWTPSTCFRLGFNTCACLHTLFIRVPHLKLCFLS